MFCVIASCLIDIQRFGILQGNKCLNVFIQNSRSTRAPELRGTASPVTSSVFLESCALGLDFVAAAVGLMSIVFALGQAAESVTKSGCVLKPPPK